MDERETILGIGGSEEGSGSLSYDLNGVNLGSFTIEANGSEDPLKDILDYDLKSTTDILVRYPDGREVKFIRSDLVEQIEKKAYSRGYSRGYADGDEDHFGVSDL